MVTTKTLYTFIHVLQFGERIILFINFHMMMRVQVKWDNDLYKLMKEHFQDIFNTMEEDVD